MADTGDDLKVILSSASLIIIGGVINSGGTLVERIVIGRLLSPDKYGEVAVALAVLTFASTFALVGFSQGIPRYLSRYDEPADRRGVWLGGLVFTGAISLAVGAAAFLSAGRIAAALFHEPSAAALVRVFAVAIPFVVGQQIVVNTIRGYENTVYRIYVQDLFYPVGRIALIAALLWAGMGVLAAGYAYLIAAALSCLFGHYLLRRLLPLRGPHRTHVREMLMFSAPLIVSTMMSLLLTKTDTVMVSYFKSTAEAGLYDASYAIAAGLLIVLSAFGFMFLPIASRLDADGEREEINRIYQITTKWVYVITFPGFLAFLVFPADVIRITYGAQYTSAAPSLAILSVGFFLSAAVGRNREALSAIGYTNFILVANLTGFVFNFLLNLVLIPRYSFMGAAFTSTLSSFLIHGIINGVLWKYCDITPISQANVRTAVLLPVCLLPPAAVLGQYVSLSAVTLLPFLVVVGLAGIGVLIAGGALQPEDKVIVEVVEERIGIKIPLVRRYLPAGQ
ncbi:flippase [Halegenticoccus tardaugens]|uniref:flippase n=1 Tax=Halegenticoccus tardaugens TaxID=2071624 RepID=UPI00100BE2BD|nr:flippase [Halegenticoccus tardaugens]